MDKATVDRLRAVEALRAGVPNRDVVRYLPPMQTSVERAFGALLNAAGESLTRGKPATGLLLAGDFGAGKSHWLDYLRHRAFEENFICSHVVLNKETPLHDFGLILRACLRSAAATDRLGPALSEVALHYDPEEVPGYRDLFEWVHRDRDADPRLAATLYLFEHSADEELREAILDEWMGFPMNVSALKRALKESGAAGAYRVSRPARGQERRRLEFLARFFHSAGYRGWVLLFDETEMVSKYSLRQRGRAYAHLAQLLNLAGDGVAGIASIFTITKDYVGQVLLGRKNDLNVIPERLAGTCDAPLAADAEAGMRAIELKSVDLRPPTPAQVHQIQEKVRTLYSEAYGWEAPPVEGRREYMSSAGWRPYVRTWITTWDLRRLYGVESAPVAEAVRLSYEEDRDLQ